MIRTLTRRICYRVRQFVQAIRASLSPVSETEAAEVRAYLPEAAWALFNAMWAADRRHGLEVLHTLRAKREDHPALVQAALLHDCAKHEGEVRLWHRVAFVLVNAFYPRLLARWTDMAAPARNDWRYPFWTHVHHPERGARLAAAAGCDPLAVTLIRYHQDRLPAGTGDPSADALLAALQAADDDN